MDIINFENLKNFVKIHTSSYDESHDYNHALNVFENSVKITNFENIINPDWNLIAYTAFLHDVCDHKYKSSITKDDLLKFVEDNLGLEKALMVLKIINNISYTQEVKGELEDFEEPFKTYRNIISDADKLEALGEVGLRRCQQFSAARNGNVIEHCHEKLLKLLPNGFIRTDAGKKMALPGHNFILDFCNRNSS